MKHMKVDPGTAIENIAKEMDKDKNGKISFKEASNWLSSKANFKLIMVVILSFLIQPAIEFIQSGFILNNWSFTGILSTIVEVIVPFTIIYYARIMMRPMDDELVSLKESIVQKDKEIYDLKLEKMKTIQEYEGLLSKQKLDHAFQLSQLEGALKCKDQEIDWREKGLIMKK